MIKFLLKRRFTHSSIPSDIKLIGSLEYPQHNKPLLKLSKPSEFLLALKPYHTINQLAKFVQNQDSSITSLTVYHEIEKSELQKWSQYNTIEDVVEFALKNNEPRLYLKFNDEISFLKLPTLNERLDPWVNELETLNKELEPLLKIKDGCDLKASKHSTRLVYGGLAGLMTQWLVLARFTWWEYSWDVIEPITWFTGMGNSILAYIFFVVYKKDFSCEVLSTMTVTSKQRALYLKNGLDVDKLAQLFSRKQEIEKQVLDIKELYD